jgi:predicted ribonuclease YlaK
LPDRAPCYLQACKDRDIITDEASVLQVLEQYAANQMLGSTAALDLFQKFLTDHPLDEEPAQFSTHGSAQDRAAAYIAEMNAESGDLGDYQLSAEQQHAIDQICSNPTGLHIISGIAGSGKTFVAQVLPHTY